MSVLVQVSTAISWTIYHYLLYNCYMKKKQKRGFALLSPERRKEIARKAGRASAKSPNARRWTPEEARRAGKKGGGNVSNLLILKREAVIVD